MIRCRRNHKARMNRLFRDQINPLKIFDDVELCVKLRSRCVLILTIVDELQEAIEHQLTRQARPQCSDSGSVSDSASGSDSVASVRCSSTSSSTSVFQVRIKYENNS